MKILLDRQNKYSQNCNCSDDWGQIFMKQSCDIFVVSIVATITSLSLPQIMNALVLAGPISRPICITISH